MSKLIAADIAQAAHRHCGDNSGHEWNGHMMTSSYYAEYLNAKGIDVSAERFIHILTEIAGAPDKGFWNGHPHPDLIIAEIGRDS